MKTRCTAAITNYLIERIGRRVALCESQGGRWITIQHSITPRDARIYGFNLDAPGVQAVFAGAGLPTTTEEA